MKPSNATANVPIIRVFQDGSKPAEDAVIIEEPLEIRLGHGPEEARQHQSLSITMRTPGDDFNLAVGFLYTESIIRQSGDVDRVFFCGPPPPGRETSNIVRVELNPAVDVDLQRLQRHFYTTSSCGVCGKTSLEALKIRECPSLQSNDFSISDSWVHQLNPALSQAQTLFGQTGGLHAAGLFDAQGQLIDIREDIGRHNAVDKLIGNQLLENELPSSDRVMMVSGRTSFEIMQKALMAGLPVVAAVGAPSSLAIDIAHEFGMTLIGFVRDGRFNVYSGSQRVISQTGDSHHQ